MERNAVNWFEIYVDDMPRAKKFYETVFQKELMELPMPAEGMQEQMFAFPGVENAPAAAGALVKNKKAKAGTGGTLVYFGCDDCSVEASRVVAAGGTLEAPKFSIGPHGFIAIFVDTEGNTVGLHSEK